MKQQQALRRRRRNNLARSSQVTKLSRASLFVFVGKRLATEKKRLLFLLRFAAPIRRLINLFDEPSRPANYTSRRLRRALLVRLNHPIEDELLKLVRHMLRVQVRKIVLVADR